MGGEVTRQELFKVLAKSVSEAPSLFSTSCKLLDKFKFSTNLCVDVATAFIAIGTDGWTSDGFEGIWSIVQYLISCVFVFSVVLYSSSGRCLTLDFLLILLGLYDIQWFMRKRRNDLLHRPKVKAYVEANERRYQRYTSVELWHVTALITNELVDAKLEFVYATTAELLLAVAKIYFAMAGPLDFCSFHNVLRTLVVVFGLWGQIKAVVHEELQTMKFLKILNLVSAYDAEDYTNFNTNFQTKLTTLATYIFHGSSIVYRALIISLYFKLSIWLGFLHFTILLVSSLTQYRLFGRPKYENAPVGAPTRIYVILEIFCGIFTKRNHRISSSSPCKQLAGILMFILVKAIEHFGLFYMLLTIYSYIYPNSVCEHQLMPCENTIYDIISKIFAFFSLHFEASGTYAADLIFKNLFIHGMLLSHLIYSIFYFFYLHFSGLNDDRFPAHAAIHIWGEKLLNKNWDRMPNVWVLKMMLCTVSSRPIEVLQALPNVPIKNSTEWIDLIEAELGNLNVPMTALELKQELLEDHPMRDQLGELVAYAYLLRNEEISILRMTRGLCYKFCRDFEEAMNNMNSYKIACICKMLDESPIVQSDFTDDPIADSWFWVFK